MKKLLFVFIGIIINIHLSQAQAPFTAPDNIGSGNCLDFDGVSDWINVPDSPSLNTTGDLTIEAWINLQTTAVQQWLVSKYNSAPDASYTFIIQNNSTLQFFIQGTAALGSNMWVNTTSAPLNVGEWQHVAAVFDASASTMNIYVNGIDQPVTLNGSQTSINSTTLAVGIGARNATSATYFDGQIDDVRIWNIARTQQEIQDNMCQALDRALEPNLVGCWNMNEGTGGIITDLTANGNDGTLQ